MVVTPGNSVPSPLIHLPIAWWGRQENSVPSTKVTYAVTTDRTSLVDPCWICVECPASYAEVDLLLFSLACVLPFFVQSPVGRGLFEPSIRQAIDEFQAGSASALIRLLRAVPRLLKASPELLELYLEELQSPRSALRKMLSETPVAPLFLSATTEELFARVGMNVGAETRRSHGAFVFRDVLFPHPLVQSSEPSYGKREHMLLNELSTLHGRPVGIEDREFVSAKAAMWRAEKKTFRMGAVILPCRLHIEQRLPVQVDEPVSAWEDMTVDEPSALPDRRFFSWDFEAPFGLGPLLDHLSQVPVAASARFNQTPLEPPHAHGTRPR